jgi:hypothetical protein
MYYVIHREGNVESDKYELKCHSSWCVIQYVYDVIDVKRILDKHIVSLSLWKPHTYTIWQVIKFVMLF